MELLWQQRLGVWWIAEDHPDVPALVHADSGEVLTFAELAGRAHQLLHGLRQLGVMSGDIVAYALPNGIDIVVWQLAAQEGGLRSIALNPALSGAEIRGILDHSGAVLVAVHEGFARQVASLIEAPSVVHRVSVGGPIEGFMEQSTVVARQPTTAPSDRSLGMPVPYSSGTTGTPKAVWREAPDVDPSVAADAMKSFAQAFRFQPLEGAHLVSAGMHHGGCQSFFHGALNVGQTLVVMTKFDAETALALIERHRVTTAYMVPTQFVRLLRLPEEVRTRYDTSSLEVVVHAAAPCPREIKQQMFDWWGPVIWETYGGMEGAATIAKPHHWLARPGTVGRAIRGMAVRILDDDGNELASEEVGHVFMEPTGPSFEYRGDPELTRSVHRGRAFTIGDMGYVDGDGFLFLCDRAKDLIISGGVNIYPAEVEGALSSHPKVGDVAVIGVPDPEWGEQVKAVVELIDGVEPDAGLDAELLSWCRERLAGYKCPRSIEYRSELPRTDGGKLMKRHLRDEYWAETGRQL
ncbi:MAG TPA: AMP-binding protein [Microthrixaceae bacterium]|nr:AMP-binding protein [Microthrixaceae bacterium]